MTGASTTCLKPQQVANPQKSKDASANNVTPALQKTFCLSQSDYGRGPEVPKVRHAHDGLCTTSHTFFAPALAAMRANKAKGPANSSIGGLIGGEMHKTWCWQGHKSIARV
eukprot:816515-Amphidinium_carterae.1